MTTGCPLPEVLARAISEGASAEIAGHVAACGACGAEWESADRLRELARAMPFEAPIAERALSVRQRILTEAVAVRRRSRFRVGVAAALAAAAAAVLSIGLGRPAREPAVTMAPRYHGAIVALNGARWSRQSAAPDEVVRLESGTIHVEVTPLGPGERFRVLAGDGEVEVRGTAFDVAVEAGRMTRVVVDHGRVEVHGVGAPGAVLAAGEKWRASDVAPPAGASSDVLPPASDVAPIESAPALPPAHDVVPPAGTHASPSTSKSTAHVPPGASAGPAVEVPEVATRSAVAPALPPPVAVPTALPSPTVVPKAPPSVPAPSSETVPSHGDRTRDEDRRERRDERRQRHDERRLR